jgi:hypothetical protein
MAQATSLDASYLPIEALGLIQPATLMETDSLPEHLLQI